MFMATLQQFLSQVKNAECTQGGPLVETTVAREFIAGLTHGAGLTAAPGTAAPAGSLRIAVIGDASATRSLHPALEGKAHWMMLRCADGKGVELFASHPHLLYQLWTLASGEWKDLDVTSFRQGKIVVPTFPGMRPVYDIFLTQIARTVRCFDRDEHFRTIARMGSSYAEVNGLAFPVPFETGPKGELLHRFYTYCPALDQFVTSRLNKGFYDQDYLQANLNNLKTNAEYAEKYGLTPGLVCFEPRSVPDELLQQYPVLRGARVDHPMRSFRPRFNLSVAHPVVLDHYAEMMENLMHEVPKLGYMSIWSNDSGAGFEYTSSLYVGRNGGGYLVREWLAAKDIAAAAAINLVRFMKTLRDAGRKVNPRFRTLIRLEPFWEEHDHIWKQLENGLDVEVSSLLTRGWDLAYKHPKYDEVPQIHGTALYSTFVEKEREIMSDLESKGASADIYFVPGILGNHEPLIGIPFPGLVHRKLAEMADRKVETAAYQGGVTQPSFAPYNINQEVMRAFQFDRNMDVKAFVRAKAVAWIGEDLADDLIQLWDMSEDAFTSFPIPIWIYSGWSVWYRLAIRPIVPNIEAIPESDRTYYEDFLLATTHNKTRVDFRWDVGFDLMEPERGWKAVQHMADDLFPVMEKAVLHAEAMLRKARTDAARACAQDQYDRMRALLCWYRTQYATTAWVAAVHTYLGTTDKKERARCKGVLRAMVLGEIQNTKDLLQLWENSTTNWIIISDVAETTFIYYKNFGELLKKKIVLMTGHEDDDPYVDPEFQWRVPGFTPEKKA
jgi:hypothetical protein